MGLPESASATLILDELFGGIGGFSEAARITGGFTTQNYVDIDPDAQAVYRHHHPAVAIHADIRTYHPGGRSDAYAIGFPCTGTSGAGSRTGLNHAESGLWFEALRCIIEGHPNFVVIENPEGLIHRGLREVLGGLRMAGYTWGTPQLISAAWLGYPHERNRVFIVAHTNNLSKRFRQLPTRWADQIGIDLAPSLPKRGKAQPSSDGLDDGVPPWLRGRCFDASLIGYPAPRTCGISHHTPKRRTACDLYGRSVMPQQAAIALRRVLYLNSILGE